MTDVLMTMAQANLFVALLGLSLVGVGTLLVLLRDWAAHEI